MRLLKIGTLSCLIVIALVVGVVTLRTLSIARPRGVSTPAKSEEIPEIANRLATMVRFQTIVGGNESRNQSIVFSDQRAWLARTYPALHKTAPPVILSNGTMLFEWQGKSKFKAPIILMAHQDVVPVQDPATWRHDPFSGAISDGAVWGRGSLDDKSSIIALFETVERLIKGGFQPDRTVWLVFGADEEQNGLGAQAAADFLESRKVKALYALDEGSLIVIDHPVTGGPVALIGISEKGYATLRLTASGSAGHASAPPQNTAVSTLSNALVRVSRHPFRERLDGPTALMMDALAPNSPLTVRMAIANRWLFDPILISQIGASPQGAAMLHTTIAPTMLSGSPKDNILPVTASAEINYRIAPGDTVGGVVEATKRAIGRLPVSVTVEPGAHSPSPVSSIKSGGYRAISAAIRKVFAVPVAPAPVIAATDSRHMIRVAQDIYRFQPVALRLSETGMMHGTDERMRVDDLDRMVGFYTAILRSPEQ